MVPDYLFLKSSTGSFLLCIQSPLQHDCVVLQQPYDTGDSSLHFQLLLNAWFLIPNFKGLFYKTNYIPSQNE